MTEPDHTDIGAYVLGLLEPREAERFEEHLLGCERCVAELDDFSELPELLRPMIQVTDSGPGSAAETAADADADSGPDPDLGRDSAQRSDRDAASPAGAARTNPSAEAAQPSADLLPKLLGGVAAERSRRRRRSMLALAAVAVLLIAGPAVGVVVGRHSAAAAKPTDKVAAELIMMGERHTAADPATGVSAVVGLEQRDWGSHIAIQLSGLRGPLKCDLVAVAKDGSTQVIANWLVPDHGYGVPGHQDPLDMHGSAALDKADLDHVEVRTATGQVLVSVPV